MGGSGFSFADLLADRAGTDFALAATRDEPTADLPEGVPDAQLQSDYGGVGGRRYKQVVDEIERRLAGCWFAGL